MPDFTKFNNKLTKVTASAEEGMLNTLTTAMRKLTQRITLAINETATWDYTAIAQAIEIMQRELDAAGLTDLANEFKTTAVSQFQEASKLVSFSETSSNAFAATANMKMEGWTKTVEQPLLDWIQERLSYQVVDPVSAPVLVDELMKEFQDVTAKDAATYIRSSLNQQQNETLRLTGKELGADYYQYVGPDDSRTRDYCKERLNKVFTSDQAEEIMNSDERWNCRHVLVPYFGSERPEE